jgi:hypothetical protein
MPPWTALLVGMAASLAANVAVGGHDPIGRALAGWPAISPLVSIKLLFSMFEQHHEDQQAVRDDQPTVPDSPPVRWTAPQTIRDHARPARPAGTTGEPGTDGTGPAPAVPSAQPGARTRTHRGVATDVHDVAALIPPARAARAALTATGQRLSRDGLADRMRNDGHGVSNARACLLVKILRAEKDATPPGPADTADLDPNKLDQSSDAAARHLRDGQRATGGVTTTALGPVHAAPSRPRGNTPLHPANALRADHQDEEAEANVPPM